MATLYRNFLAGTITDNPLSSGATTINSAGFANLPVVTGPDIMWLVLDPDAATGAPELVKVTAHTSSATSVTVVRAQQSTSARSCVTGTVWRIVATQTDLESFLTAVPTNHIVQSMMADNSVGTAELINANVTLAKLASDSVDASKIVDGSVGTNELAAGAVTSAKIGAQAVRPAAFSPSVFTRGNGQVVLNGNSDPVTFTTEAQDLDGWGTVSTSTFTCPATGVYIFATELIWATTPGGLATIRVEVNSQAAGGSGYINGTVDEAGGLLFMTAGDTVKLIAINSSGGNLTINSAKIALLRIF